jgi:hypothetical protein
LAVPGAVVVLSGGESVEILSIPVVPGFGGGVEIGLGGIVEEVLLVAGEMFSWYGSRLVKAVDYRQSLTANS